MAELVEGGEACFLKIGSISGVGGGGGDCTFGQYRLEGPEGEN